MRSLNGKSRYVLCLSAFLAIALPIGSGVLSVSLSDLRDHVKNGYVKSQRIDETTSRRVTIDENEYGTVYVKYDEPNSDGTENEDDETLSDLYTFVNCEFAAWTRNELFKIARRFPVSVSNSFAANDHLFRENYVDLVADLDRVLSKTERFVVVLYNFANALRDDASFDRYLLGRLFALNLKIGLIKTARKDQSDVAIVGTMLETINSIRIFEAFNCELPRSFYDNGDSSPFSSDDLNDNDDGIATFLKHIEPIKLESNAHCPSENWLSSLDVIYGELDKVKWKQNDGDEINAAEFLRDLKTSYDPQLDYKYKRQFLDTVMKILFERSMDSYNRFQTFSREFVEAIRELRSYILFVNENFASDLNACFDSLILVHDKNKSPETETFDEKSLLEINILKKQSSEENVY